METNAKTIVEIYFRGIDNWNRPVFKDVNSVSHYGSTSRLFPNKVLFPNSSESDIISFFRDNIRELEYFGNHFDCEPNGGLPDEIELKIVDKPRKAK